MDWRTSVIWTLAAFLATAALASYGLGYHALNTGPTPEAARQALEHAKQRENAARHELTTLSDEHQEERRAMEAKWETEEIATPKENYHYGKLVVHHDEERAEAHRAWVKTLKDLVEAIAALEKALSAAAATDNPPAAPPEPSQP